MQGRGESRRQYQQVVRPEKQAKTGRDFEHDSQFIQALNGGHSQDIVQIPSSGTHDMTLQEHRRPFDLLTTHFHIGDATAATALKAAANFWENLTTSGALNGGRIISSYDVRVAEDLHPFLWEMHPAGDEVLLMCSGALEVVISNDGEEEILPLTAATGLIVPAGAWHRLVLRAPGLLIAVTSHEGTQLAAFPPTNVT